MIDINKIKLFVFDFDGVLTDNKFYLNEKGIESVKLSRSDGLAFDMLHSLKKRIIVLSSEKNPIVSMRSKKLNVEALYGVKNKEETLRNYCNNNKLLLDDVFYVGNDVNDLKAMMLCGYRACPKDSHDKIKQISLYCLQSLGGDGVIREMVEDLFGLEVNML